MPTFELGRIVITPKAAASIARSGQEPSFFLEKHSRIDQGILNDEDHALNLEAIKPGGPADWPACSRVFTAFKTLLGDKMWVITEWDRSVTTILTPDDY